MAAQVLTGTGNVSYTNNTGQNVRIIINFCQFSPTAATSVNISAGGATFAASNVSGFGKNYAYSSARTSSSNMNSAADASLPTELMLSAGQTFSLVTAAALGSTAAAASYNIVVIPEAG